MAKTKWNREVAIRGALRRVFSRSPVIWEALRKVRREVPRYRQDGSRAKKDAVQYLCNICKNYVRSTMVSVDHIIPVVSIDEGFVDFNTFIARLFCDASNLQVICDDDHQKKTNAERSERNRKKDLAELNQIQSTIAWGLPKEHKKNLKRFLSPKKHGDVRTVAAGLIQQLEKMV